MRCCPQTLIPSCWPWIPWPTGRGPPCWRPGSAPDRGGAACAKMGVWVWDSRVHCCSDFRRAPLPSLPLPPPALRRLPAHSCPRRGVWSCRCVSGREGRGGWCHGGETEILSILSQRHWQESFARKATPTSCALLHSADPCLLVMMKGDCRTLQQRMLWLL